MLYANSQQQSFWLRAVQTGALMALVIFTAASCSVFMATKQPDKKDVSVFVKGTPRSVVMAEFGSPVQTEEKDGCKIDTFRFKQGYSKTAKAGRALFHATADVLTIGLWEAAGTPVEAIFTGDDAIVVVRYGTDDRVAAVEYVKGVEL
jgi:hypothetical protein